MRCGSFPSFATWIGLAWHLCSVAQDAVPRGRDLSSERINMALRVRNGAEWEIPRSRTG